MLNLTMGRSQRLEIISEISQWTEIWIELMIFDDRKLGNEFVEGIWNYASMTREPKDMIHPFPCEIVAKYGR